MIFVKYTPFLIKYIALVVFICLFTCGCGKAIEIPAIKTEVNEYLEKTIEVKQPCSLNLECDSADIEVYTWNRQEMKFEITKKVRGIGKKENLEKFLDNFNIVLEHEAGNVTFKSEYKGSTGSPSDVGISLKVYLPKKTELIKCVLDIGKIRILDDIRCQLNANINMANLTINRFEGLLRLKADMCDLRIAEGKIYPGSSIEIGMGNIQIKSEFEDSDDYKIQTEMGNVEINVPAGSAARFYAADSRNGGESAGKPGIKVRSGMGHVTISEY